MATQRSEHRHIIEISGDVQVVGTSLRQHVRNCGKSICEFSDAKTTIKDAKERSAAMRKLMISIVLCIIFMSVEVVGGIKSNSLAILTDAAHLLSDIAAFSISLFSLWATGWKANRQHSYGFFRMEILGALVSVQMIWLLTGILIYQAIYRLINDTGEVDGFLMFLVSAFGLVVNTVMALLLGHDHGHGGHDHGHGHGHGGHDDGHRHEDHEIIRSQGMTIVTHHHQHHSGEHCEHDDEHHHDLAEPLVNTAYEVKPKKQRNINIQGAYLHVLGDIIQGIGVTISGLVIWYKPEWKVIDLMCTLIFSVIALATTIKLLRNILAILMETTPREVDVTTLERGLLDMEQVAAIHELHVWAITTGKVLLACHVIIKPNVDSAVMLDKIVDYIRSEYNISHVTIQIEQSVD